MLHFFISLWTIVISSSIDPGFLPYMDGLINKIKTIIVLYLKIPFKGCWIWFTLKDIFDFIQTLCRYHCINIVENYMIFACALERVKFDLYQISCFDIIIYIFCLYVSCQGLIAFKIKTFWFLLFLLLLLRCGNNYNRPCKFEFDDFTSIG